MSYGRQAEAACVASPAAPSYSCSGASGTQSLLNITSADVSTVAGFGVTATGLDNGITVTGNGQLSYIDANASPITSESGTGLVVHSNGNVAGETPEDGGVLIDTNGDISGTTGIDARNDGAGDVSVTVAGAVTGRTGDGIHARNSGSDLTILTGAGAISGGEDGIDARNGGSGDLKITANGDVAGFAGAGIYARNSGDGVNLAIITGPQSAISGKYDGIYADNSGTGDLDITVNGRVEGLQNDGINAENGSYSGGYGEYSVQGVNLTVLTGAQSTVVGLADGVDAENDGTGKLEITVNGTVIGTEDNGIEADNSRDGTFLTITTNAGSVVRGGDDGINAENDGDGDLTINVNGRVTGESQDGIYAENDGTGDTRITVGESGIVEGRQTAIDVESDGGQDIYITNYGTVRNLSGNSSYIAIESWGGDTEIDNYGIITGVVRLGDDDDHIDNYGVWNTAGGTNEFGWDTDRVHNFGVLVAANDAQADETTELLNLEEFGNDGGLIWLADGAVGDTLRMRGEIDSGFEVPLRYDAEDGYLAVDAALGAGAAGESDILEIIGNVDEDSTTTIAVNVVGVSGANMLGIPVVKVIDGETGPDNFSLAGSVQGGLFAWDLRFDAEENWYELFTSGIGIGAYEMAAGLTGAQDIWHQTTGTLAQRQADLRPLLNGTQVTPVADFTEPVAPTAAGRVGPGFWFNAVGGWLERDAEQDGYTLDRKQSIYGGLAGFDFAADGDTNGTWLFGLFGGYLSSTLKFSETNSKWTYDGPTIGAYATYLNEAFYVDLTVKADFLSIDIEQEDLGADDSDTDGFNLGGRIDAGYKIGGGEGAFVEPQATLAVVNTDVDDAKVGGADVDFDSETSVKGRLGLKLGYDHTASNAMIFSSDLTASVWQEFNGSNDASIMAAGLGDFGVSDNTIGTLGDISLGFSVTAAGGWSGYLRANYQFAEDFEAITGNAGLRYGW